MPIVITQFDWVQWDWSRCAPSYLGTSKRQAMLTAFEKQFVSPYEGHYASRFWRSWNAPVLGLCGGSDSASLLATNSQPHPSLRTLTPRSTIHLDRNTDLENSRPTLSLDFRRGHLGAGGLPAGTITVLTLTGDRAAPVDVRVAA